MRFGLIVIGILISGMFFQLFLPWWSLVVIAFAWGYGVPLFPKAYSFWAGFLAGLLLWGGYAFYLNLANAGLLAGKIGELLGGIPAIWLPFLSGAFAGLLSGLSALSGRLGWEVTRRETTSGA